MRLIKSAKTAFLILLGSLLLLALTVSSRSMINFLLISALFVLITTGARQAYVWTLIAGVVLETISPFPSFVSMATLLFTVFCAHFLIKNYLSHRTFLGIIPGAVLASLIYEISTFLFSRLVNLIFRGFTPALDFSYGIFMVLRLLWTTLVFAILFLIVQRLFPRVRGTLLAS